MKTKYRIVQNGLDEFFVQEAIAADGESVLWENCCRCESLEDARGRLERMRKYIEYEAKRRELTVIEEVEI